MLAGLKRQAMKEMTLTQVLRWVDVEVGTIGSSFDANLTDVDYFPSHLPLCIPKAVCSGTTLLGYITQFNYFYKNLGDAQAETPGQSLGACACLINSIKTFYATCWEGIDSAGLSFSSSRQQLTFTNTFPAECHLSGKCPTSDDVNLSAVSYSRNFWDISYYSVKCVLFEMLIEFWGFEYASRQAERWYASMSIR